MRLEVTWNDERSELELEEGELSWGGAPEDGLQFPGLPPALAVARIRGGRLTLTPACALRVGGVLSPRHVERLVLPGEVVELDEGVRVVVPKVPDDGRETIGTAVVMSELLAGKPPRQPQQTRAAYFDCVAGVDLGAQLAVAYVDCVLGRGTDAQLRLRDPAVSRHHARLARDGKQWHLTPMPSTNGVYVNGQRLRGSHPLAAGDIVELGRTLLRFEPEAKAQEEYTVAAPQPAEQAPQPVEAPAVPVQPALSESAEPVEVTSTERLPSALPIERPSRRGWWILVPGTLAALSAAVAWLLLTRV